MEESIGSLCKGVASFCNHLQSSCDALKTSVDRRPIPLDTASSTFLQSLNRRVSAASTQLNLLDTMSFGTVSFEELLGHCSEVYKDNQTRLLHLQHRLSPSFVAELEIDDDEDFTSTTVDQEHGFDASVIDEEEDLLDESLSLKKLGLSDASLASLANDKNEDTDVSMQELKSLKGSYDPSTKTSGASGDRLLSDFGEVEDKPKLAEVHLHLVKVSPDDYESLPSYMKSLAPWEDLLAAVEKINSSLKQKARGTNFFHQDEISSLGLGPKARSYLLLLVRMNRLVVETVSGLISYRVL
ncbi:hypothetical protein D8674_011178 [Pyrus ussuriensis x Pyrus communis]|uniref:Uncharacterized protein n=1 Tax=Pyrus ussuriensis x Pyrus communis TaxID=2448454 RepID=A0A5N5G2T6_9ROSA|nr:hypothetical protein D8674_011178 [Pyrus ussuriensis x Pyrus communis]